MTTIFRLRQCSQRNPDTIQHTYNVLQTPIQCNTCTMYVIHIWWKKGVKSIKRQEACGKKALQIAGLPSLGCRKLSFASKPPACQPAIGNELKGAHCQNAKMPIQNNLVKGKRVKSIKLKTNLLEVNLKVVRFPDPLGKCQLGNQPNL